MAPIIGAASSAGGRIGRHFSVAALLPGLFLTLWLSALVASGAVTGSPSLTSLGHSFDSLAHAAWLIIIAIAAGLFVHPLQFSIIQLFEGYWGAGRLGVAAAHFRVVHYRRRERHLDETIAGAQQRMAEESAGEDYLLDNERGDRLMYAYIQNQEALRLHGRYPAEQRRIMPTRLGNALRGYEDAAGRPYGLDALQVVPYLSVMATPDQLSYLRGAREELDTTVSLCAACLLAALISVGFLVTDRFWLLAALIPYGLAYISYRGALVAAEEYGTALSVVVGLSRFDLYRQLHLPLPKSVREERRRNVELTSLLNYGRGNDPDDGEVNLIYKHAPE